MRESKIWPAWHKDIMARFDPSAARNPDNEMITATREASGKPSQAPGTRSEPYLIPAWLAVPKLISLNPTLAEALVEIERKIQKIHQIESTAIYPTTQLAK
jgi:hypothetical protein